VISAKAKRCGVRILFVVLGGCRDVVGPAPTLTGVVLSPASAVLHTGGSQRFAAIAQLSDGATITAMVTYQVTGGSISSAGVYTAGQTAGTFQVIALQSGGTLADTAVVTVIAPTPPPPPPPPTGTTFFRANGEAGGVKPPWSWQVAEWSAGAPMVMASQTRAKNGLWSYEFEISDPAYLARDAHSTQVLSGGPQVSMGSPHGRYLGGYYSWWTYIDAGFTESSVWNVWLGFMTGVDGAPDPICNVGLEVKGGILQIIFTLKNATRFNRYYNPPVIAGYTMDNGWYSMTASSPAGIKAFPRNQWVHTVVYNNFQQSNGHIKIWQDGVLIMDLTHPTMDLFTGWGTLSNTAGDMLLQFGIYGGPRSGTQRFFMDDFQVTDFQPVP
jgi:hypothetical protein